MSPVNDVLFVPLVLMWLTTATGRAGDTYSALLDADVPLANVVGPLESLGTPKQLPITVQPFIEHVRESVPGAPSAGVTSLYFDESGALVVVTAGGLVAVWQRQPVARGSDCVHRRRKRVRLD